MGLRALSQIGADPFGSVSAGLPAGIPYYVAGGTFTLSGAAGTKTVNLTGATRLENDIIVVGAAQDGTAAMGNPIMVTSGYNYLLDNEATGFPDCAALWKRMGASPDSDIQLTHSGTGIASGLWQIFREVDTTSAIDNSVTTQTGISPNTPNPPDYTTVTNNAMRVVMGFLDDDDVAGSVVGPAGYTNLLANDTGQVSTTVGATVMIASKLAATAGAENPAPFTSATGDDNVAIHFALRPIAAVTAPTITAVGTITGTLAVGATLTHAGLTTAGTSPTVVRQWRADGVNISGATGSTYLVTATEAGKSITVYVTATNSAASVNSTTPGVSIPAAWTPSFVSNVDTGAGPGTLSYDGGTPIGADSTKLEIVMGFKRIDLNTLTCKVWTDHSARVDIGITGGGRVTAVLRTSTPTTLVDWTAGIGSALNTADEREIRWRFDGVAGTFEVYTRIFTANVPGAWTLLGGAYATGPLTGTLDSARTGTGVDSAILSNGSLTSNFAGHFSHAWRSQQGLLGMDAFGAAGAARVDPATVTPYDCLIVGPLASLPNDLAGKTWTVAGSMVNV